MNNKILIIYTSDGYDLILEDGTPMEFTDNTQTSGFSDMKEAVKVCVDHEYQFEIV